MDYMNKTQGCAYDVNPVLDGIDDHIARLKQIEPWGYSTAYALSAKYNLHRNYAEFLLGKGRLRAKQINRILASVEEDKKAAYDEGYIESLYERFQNHEIDDSKLIVRLEREWKKREILIVAPGHSVIAQKERIDRFIREKDPLIISANFIPEFYQQDYIFCSNAMRYSAMEDKCDLGRLLITSNVMEVCEAPNVLNYSDLCFDDRGKCDNCVIMLMNLLIRLGKEKVYVAGFDGYRADACNYISSYMMNQHTRGQEENIKNAGYVADIRKKLEVLFITDSLYDK